MLFADVVGFTTLAESADPETVARTVDSAFRRMADVVADHGGTVDKYMGDCVMAVFGVPVAHDDDAERAVACGLAMRQLGGDLAFSIGVNTGEVMVASVGRDEDFTVMGDTVNVAARLEKAAGAGEVLVGPLTAELAGERVVLVERDPVALKGKREPVPVWEAVAVRGDPARQREVPPLVGRDDELAFLLSQWRRACRDGRVQVVVVAGDAGVGKTRLVDELAARVACEAHVARASYPGYGGFGGPRLAAEVIEQLGPVGEPEVDTRVQAIAGDLDPSLSSLDSSAMQAEQAWAFRRLLEIKADERPLLITIDDIHRAGDQTLELLQKLASRVGDVPLLLVVSGRPDPGDWLTRFPSATTVRLTPLGGDEARVLAAALVPDVALSDDAVTSLVQRSAGNPLYLRELVNVVRASGALVAKNGAHDLVGGVALPPSLRAVLAARLDALRPDEKSALQHVAVLGEEAREQQVSALGLDGAGEALGSLVRAGLLRFSADECYDVADPLLREVAYEALPHSARAERHRAAARASADVVDRARHLERAANYLPDDRELAAEAAAALGQGGVKLLHAYREADALRLLTRGFALGLRDKPILLEMAQALANNARGDDARDVLRALREGDLSDAERAECDQIEAISVMWADPGRAIELLERNASVWAGVGDIVKEGWAHSNRGVALFNIGRMPEAAAALEFALERFREAGDPDGLQGRLAASSFLGLMRPEHPRVPEWLGEALRHAEAAGDRTNQANTMVLLAWHHTFRSHQGGPAETAEAERCARRAAELSQELAFPEFEAHGLAIAAVLARFSGRLDEAAALVERMRTVELPEHSGIAHFARSVEFAVALASAAEATRPAPPSIDSPDPVAWMGWVVDVETLALAGRVDEAIAWFDEGAQPSMAALDGMLVQWPRGLALVLKGRHADALAPLEQALTSAELVHAGPAAAATRALLSEAAFRLGRPDDARRLLDEVGEGPSGGVAGALVWRARAVLGEPGAEEALRHAARQLRTPGLLLGLAGTI